MAKARLNQGSIAVQSDQRIIWLDVLRGAALFGIAQINFPSFAAGQLPVSSLYDAPPSRLDELLYGAITLLVTAKFYPVFAFLFGYGHALQRRRLACLGVDVETILMRRYGALLLFGVVHGSLLFFGDILTMYAIAGIILLAESRSNRAGSPSALLRWGAVSLVMTALYCVGLPHFPASVHADWVRMHASEVELMASSWSSIAADRCTLYLVGQLQQVATFLPELLLFMNAGVWACERGVLQQPRAHKALFARCLLVGVALGLPINLALMVCELGILNQRAAPVALISVLDNLAFILSLAYLGLFGLYAAREHATLPKTVLWLAALGRMALTNYVVQSFVMMAAWYLCWRQINALGAPGALAALALLVCLLQTCWAVRQTRLERQGPFEARWRSISYGRARPSISN